MNISGNNVNISYCLKLHSQHFGLGISLHITNDIINRLLIVDVRLKKQRALEQHRKTKSQPILLWMGHMIWKLEKN